MLNTRKKRITIVEQNCIRVLVIERGSEIADFVRNSTGGSGSIEFNVTSMTDSTGGLFGISSHDYDLVLLDMDLRKGKELDTVSEILASSPDIPLIVISSSSGEDTARKAVRLGAVDYVLKDRLNSFGVERALLNAIEKAKLQVELEQYTRELWKTETNLRKILEKNADAILVVGTDKTVLYANPAVKSILGFQARDYLNKPFEYDIESGRTSEIEINHPEKGPTIAEMNVVTIEWEGRAAYLATLRDITGRKRTEMIIRQERNRAQQYLDIAGTMLLALDSDGKVTLVNKKGCQILGYGEKDIIGKDWFENFIPAEKRDEVSAVFRDIISGNIKKHEQVRNHAVVTRNGEVKLMSWRNSVIRDETGRIIGTLSSGEDVTDSQKAEQALRESEERFSRAFTSSPEMMMITSVDDSRYIEVNESFVRISGYTREEVIGRKSTDIQTWVDIQERENILQRLKTQGRLYNEETRFRRKNGEILTMLFSVEKINIGGRPCLISVFTDITDRMLASQAIRESEEKFSKAFHANTNLVAISRLSDGIFLEINEAFTAMTGYTREEAIGRNATRMGIWANEEEHRRIVRLTRENHQVTNEEITIRDKWGKLHTGLFSAEQISINGEACFIHTIIDITERKKMEDALRDSEQKFSVAFRSSPEVIVISRIEDGMILEANDTFLRLSGYSAEEVYGKTAQELNIWADPEERAEMVRLIKKDGFVRNFEFRFHTKAGEERNWLFSGEIVNIDNQPCILSVTTDITERKKTEEALRFSDIALRSIHDCVFAMDEEFNITHWNEISEKTFGVKACDAIGKPIGECIEMVEEYPGQNEERVRLLLEKGFNKEEQLYHTRGGDVWMDVHAQAIESDGKRHGWITIAADITERKKAEKAIERAAQEWRTTFDSINEMISVIDRDHKIVRVNRNFARVFDEEPRDLIGKTCYDLFHESGKRRDDCPLQTAIFTRSPVTVEYFEPKLGIYLEETTSPVFNEKGEAVYCVHVSRDITERKKAEENLRKIDEMKMEFLSSVSHELRTPLQSISGFVRLIMDGQVPDQNTQQEFLQIIDRETWHLGNLINGLLDMSRLESGRFAINKRPTAIRDTIVDTMKIFHALAREMEITLTEEIPAELPEMEIDAERMRQVIINLLSNAMKFSDPGSSIEVTAESRSDTLEFTVSDHGIGMTEEDLGHLFERFFRAEDKLARGGTGLGLYITRQIVEAHGGEIVVTSEINKGSTFKVILPMNGTGGKTIGKENTDNRR